jgi:chemotaxis protein histidine kinase CheA
MVQDFLKTGFVTEAEELLSGMEDGLLSLETSPDSAESLNGIFRAGHTIKGGAGLLNVVEIVAFTHVLENVLDRLRKKEITADQQLVTLLLSGCDVIRRLVTCVSEERPIVVDDNYGRVLAALRNVRGRHGIYREGESRWKHRTISVSVSSASACIRARTCSKPAKTR